MRFAKRLIISCLAIGLAVSSLLSACATQVSAAEISTRTIAASSGVDTLKMDVSISLGMSGYSNTNLNLSASETGSAWIDYTAKQMKLTLEGTMAIAGLSGQSFSIQQYVMNGWDYALYDLGNSDTQWMKLPEPGTGFSSQDEFAQQIQFLKTAVTTDSTGSENIGGVDCYVLQISPDLNSLTYWLKTQQAADSGDIDWSQVDPSVYKDVSLKIWVAKDSYLPAQEEIAMTVAVPLDSSTSITAAGAPSMAMQATIKYYDYNVPLTIQLPPEAASAVNFASDSLQTS